jgi:hypothetical protein
VPGFVSSARTAPLGIVGVAVIPQPEVHVIPHRTPELILVDSDSLRPATSGEEGVELARQMVGRWSAELGGDHHGLLASPQTDQPDSTGRTFVIGGRFVIDFDDDVHAAAPAASGPTFR